MDSTCIGWDPKEFMYMKWLHPNTGKDNVFSFGAVAPLIIINEKQHVALGGVQKTLQVKGGGLKPPSALAQHYKLPFGSWSIDAIWKIQFPKNWHVWANRRTQRIFYSLSTFQ